MGAGKSTVGRQLAKSLDKQFLDCDRELEERTGASISLIFELEGEEGFRRRERDMLDELTSRSGIVLATGGGAVLDSENRARLRSRGFAIYLDAPLDLLAERTSRDRSRPCSILPTPRHARKNPERARSPLPAGRRPGCEDQSRHRKARRPRDRQAPCPPLNRSKSTWEGAATRFTSVTGCSRGAVCSHPTSKAAR